MNIEELFQQYAENVGDVLSRDPRYVQLSQKSIELYRSIVDLIGKDNEYLLKAYEETEIDLTAMLEEQAYKSGFADGIKSLR